MTSWCEGATEFFIAYKGDPLIASSLILYLGLNRCNIKLPDSYKHGCRVEKTEKAGKLCWLFHAMEFKSRIVRGLYRQSTSELCRDPSKFGQSMDPDTLERQGF